MNVVIDRRSLIVGAAGLGLLAALPAAAAARGGPETVDLVISPKRATKLLVWRPARTRGVALLSTGIGSWPERYAAVIDLLIAHGFAVVAPVHVDSPHYPDHEKFGAMSALIERFADMRATSGYGAANFAGLPVIAVGHSYGSLVALCMGGALPYMGNNKDAGVKAALCFSSPGKVPNLIQPGAYAALDIPAMMITGTADLVPGFVTDPADHLFPITSAPPGERFALVLDGAEHRLVDDPVRFARARPVAADFIDGFGLGDATARARLARFKPAVGDRFLDRNLAA